MTTSDVNVSKTQYVVTPVGKWELQVRFASGEIETQEITIMPGEQSTTDGAVITLFPVAGEGYWVSTGLNTFIYHLVEKLHDQNRKTVGFVYVEQSATLSADGKSFTAAGTGTAYGLDKKQLMVAYTTTQATRL